LSTVASNQAKFVTGSTMRHVAVMTATGSVGLVAIFFVDALNLFYISMLGIQELAAAIGFASTLLFFTVSISIGFTIAASALVSRALGRGDRAEAARMGGASMLFIGSATTAVAVLSWPFLDTLVGLLGATGETRALLATRFHADRHSVARRIMAHRHVRTTGILRGVGDARRAMYVTLAGGIAAAAVLDPLFIFGFGLRSRRRGHLDGAVAPRPARNRSSMARMYVHGLIVAARRARRSAAVARPFMAIGIPGVLTQVATPVGNAYVTYEMSRFGDEAVAGWAIVGRVIPLAFGVIFALSGSVGPILGQNYGARRYDRLNQVMRDSLIFVTVYCLAAWLVLALLSSQIAGLFGAVGEARELIIFFCLFAAGSFLFNGALFVANAAFNNLGFATLSTLFNWGRSTLGVIPFVWIGAHYYGAKGVVAGWGLGAIVFGIVSLVVAFRVVRNIGVNPPPEFDPNAPPPPPAAQSPFSTGKAATLQ
jgi:Na+-driven multidrug efflux pump